MDMNSLVNKSKKRKNLTANLRNLLNKVEEQLISSFNEDISFKVNDLWYHIERIDGKSSFEGKDGYYILVSADDHYEIEYYGIHADCNGYGNIGNRCYLFAPAPRDLLLQFANNLPEIVTILEATEDKVIASINQSLKNLENYALKEAK